MTSIQATAPTPVATAVKAAPPGRTATGGPGTSGMRPDAFAQALGDAVAGDKPAAAAGPNEAPANPRETARLRRPLANDKKPETRPVAPPRDAAGADGAGAGADSATATAAHATATAGSDRGDVQPVATGPINPANITTTDAAALLAQLQRQSALQASPADEEGNVMHSDGDTTGGTGAARSTRASHTGPAALAAALLHRTGMPETGAGAGTSADHFSTALAAAAAAAVTEPQHNGTGHAQDSARADVAPSPLPLVATAQPATATATAVNTTPAAEAALQAHPASAGFGAELGAQITTFVRNGIEHARLLLNPAELGPVLLQIQIDGNTAAVHLSADLASTRQALEQALPDLAGSLREAGLTLTGGGVFQQPRPDSGASDAQGQPRNSGSRDTARETDPAGGLDATHQAAAQRRRGVVDLIA